MKNLFKNLMLVAVAAMAFTACEKDIVNGGEEQNAQGATSITFKADFADDTRSYFGEKTDEGAYPSFWEGNEVAKFNYWKSNLGNQGDKEATINDGKFTVEFGKAIDTGMIVEAYVPAASWSDVKHEWDSNYDYCEVYRTYSLPTQQNPTATSVDPKAHILKASVVADGSDNYNLIFEHQVAYGKLSLKNFAGTGVTSYVLTINDIVYVVNSENTADVWFACEPAVVENMTLSVVASEGAFTKTLVDENSDKTLKFVKGQVSTFAVKMEGVNPEGVEVVEFDGTIKSWKYKDYNKSTWDYEFLVTGDNFSFIVAQSNNYQQKLFKRSTASTLSSTASTSSKFAIREMKDSSIGVGTLSPTAGTFMVNEGGKDNEIHDVTITLTINGEEYVYTYYGYINGNAVNNDPEPTPDPVQLAAPTAPATDITAESITVSWNAVANASGYAVAINGGAAQSVAGTSYTFTGLEAETAYVITVVAKGNGSEYLDSAAATVNATTLASQTGGDEGGEGEADDAKQVTLTFFTDNGTSYVFKGDDGHNYLIAFKDFNPGVFSLIDNTTFYTSSCTWTNNNNTYFGGTPFADGDTLELIKNGSGWTATYTIIIRATVAGEKVVATCASTNFQ